MNHPGSVTIEQVGSPHVRFEVQIDDPTQPGWRAQLWQTVAIVGRLLHVTMVDGPLAGRSAFGVVSDDGTHIVGRTPFALR